MKSYSILKNSITSIAIGGFDGMHLAHQELFKHLDNHGAVVVIETGYANLTPKTARSRYTKYPVYYYPLEDIKHLDAVEFLKLLKEEYPKLNKIVVGYDFHFGANRKYSIGDLRQLFDGVVEVVNEITFDNIAVHSRVIRDFLNQGNIAQANTFLGKPYILIGRVITGQGLGKKQFVPTLNIESEDFLVPSEGIYATKTIVDEIEYQSVTFIGHRVSTDGKYAIETHILDENIEFTNPQIEIKFYDKIRNNKKFENYEELKQQILKDIDDVKRFYN